MPTPLEQTLLIREPHIAPATPDQIAENAQSQMPAWKQGVQSGIDGGMDFLKGLGGFGEGHSKSNAAGQMLTAIAPFSGKMGSGPIRELLELIRESEGPDPAKTFLGEKVGGYIVPHRSSVSPPKGFEFPPEMGTSWLGRDPALTNQYVAQKNSLPPKEPIPSPPGITYKNIKANTPYGGTGSARAEVGAKAKASPDMVRAIRKMVAEGSKLKEIQQTYPLNESTLRGIMSGDSWSSIK